MKRSGETVSAGEHNERVLGRTSIMAVVKELIRTEENGTISFGVCVLSLWTNSSGIPSTSTGTTFFCVFLNQS